MYNKIVELEFGMESMKEFIALVGDDEALEKWSVANLSKAAYIAKVCKEKLIEETNARRATMTLKEEAQYEADLDLMFPTTKGETV